MQLRFIIFLCSFFLPSISSYAQLESVAKDAIYSKVPQESIFVHYNTSFFVSGEKLFYKTYVLNKQTEKLSTLSKIAYVELIDSQKNVVLEQKIKLINGLGQGDFSIPVNLKSGAYKIIVYTKWMKNTLQPNFFHGDVYIVNPFLNSNLLSKEQNLQNKEEVNSNNSFKRHESNHILLQLQKQKFAKREKVVLNIENKSSDLITGDYSISVRKVENSISNPLTSIDFLNSLDKIKTEQRRRVEALVIPEFRGELIHGVISSSSSEDVSNSNVSLSIPGKDYVFKISSADSLGNFYFTIDRKYNQNNAIFQLVNTPLKDITIALQKALPMYYKDLIFKDFKISKDMIATVKERSIHSQIENAYQLQKTDSVVELSNKKKFYNSDTYTYFLDDFNRFKTLRETLVEIVSQVYYTQNNEQYSIQIRNKLASLSEKAATLILVDGILVQNHNDIIDYDARKIKKITVVREDYLYGGIFFNGILDIETFTNDFTFQTKQNTFFELKLPEIQPIKNYYKVDYSNIKKIKSRIPDFRHQLFWEPNVNITNEKTLVSFYTSDVSGKYEISFEGFTKKGTPISIKSYFSVE